MSDKTTSLWNDVGNKPYISVSETLYDDGDQQRAGSELTNVVSRRELNFNFIGIKILNKEGISYCNSICKCSRCEILRYYNYRKIL